MKMAAFRKPKSIKDSRGCPQQYTTIHSTQQNDIKQEQRSFWHPRLQPVDSWQRPQMFGHQI
ncbi:unnamed protein product [Periconia digitata]|uniref:Uncharacterized protein n=1 Tax=Periconia digitata TaxID=1303443 RepID=A0A9W4U9X4_9PLEO|nr:unnamed protein product [Periconia digitata]